MFISVTTNNVLDQAFMLCFKTYNISLILEVFTGSYEPAIDDSATNGQRQTIRNPQIEQLCLRSTPHSDAHAQETITASLGHRRSVRYRKNMVAASASFRWILQLHKDVPKAAKFYKEGLDFTINVCTLRWAELESGPLKLALMHSSSVTDINSTVTKLMALGAEMDGPIKYEVHGKVAAMRCIDVLTTEKLGRRFLWGGNDGKNKIHWVALKKVLSPKEKGGLGIGSLVSLNWALVTKWMWRFKSDLHALWRKYNINKTTGRVMGSMLPSQKIFIAIFYGLFWCIWKACNEKLFNKRFFYPDKVVGEMWFNKE
ncbi:unnamed protein product [Lactuca saligna]|uniref:RNA-directed DNA polymerase, eukaryota, reverse transcriptase zinc-binding domain protein n=1 Tax=Lactuca saligna TaxID=75948 RepID=A0AA35YSS1_LACSI|nr:unnamed protein product [Lactuca saligna]